MYVIAWTVICRLANSPGYDNNIQSIILEIDIILFSEVTYSIPRMRISRINK